MIIRITSVNIFNITRIIYFIAKCLHGEFRCQFLPEHGNLTVDHRRGDFRIDLSGGDIFMSQHLRKRLQTHAVRQADRRGVRVPGKVSNI